MIRVGEKVDGFWNNIRFLLIGPYPNGDMGGLVVNILLALTTMVSGFILGLLLALGRISKKKLLSRICTFIIDTIRSLPLVLIVFWFYFIIPLFAGKPIPELLSAYISISLYSVVNQAEIFRGGFATIGKEQWQAGKCTGLSRSQCMLYIILPQTLRIMLPSFVGFFISLFKDTSVISIIGVIDMTHVGLMISQKNPDKIIFSYLIMGAFYFIICFALSRAAKRIERKQQRTIRT